MVTNPTGERQQVTLSSISGEARVNLAAGETKTVLLRGKASRAAGSLSVDAVARPSGTETWSSVSMPACA